MNPAIFVSSSLAAVSYFRYPLLAIGTMVEGPVLMVTSGFLIRLGVLSLIPAYAAVVVGDLMGDIVWYWVGYFLAEPFLRKNGKFFALTPEIFEKIKGLFRRYDVFILIISKITLGLGFALGTLMAAGASRVSFKKYMTLNFFGELILAGLLMSVGYFFGEVYNKIESKFRIFFLIGIALIVVLTVYGFSRYMKKRAARL